MEMQKEAAVQHEEVLNQALRKIQILEIKNEILEANEKLAEINKKRPQ